MEGFPHIPSWKHTYVYTIDICIIYLDKLLTHIYSYIHHVQNIYAYIHEQITHIYICTLHVIPCTVTEEQHVLMSILVPVSVTLNLQGSIRSHRCKAKGEVPCDFQLLSV